MFAQRWFLFLATKNSTKRQAAFSGAGDGCRYFFLKAGAAELTGWNWNEIFGHA